MRWEDLDRLWLRVKDHGDNAWYLYHAGNEGGDTTASAAQVAEFVSGIDATLRREHREDYCGVVYVDDPADPAYIKVYHPRGMGTSCALPGHTTPATWILSRRGPARPVEPPRRGLLARLLHPGDAR